jgi:predicted P-loop ATPase
VAAVARIYKPGTKFDSVLVLDGIQGIGKSTLFKDLVGDEYYSETLSLTDMNDKSGAEKLQGFWIMEIAELAGMKKADIEKVKAFLSTSDDKYRPSYGKTVESHPRQCIIIASVNGERGYLRDITGNRRFWVVKLNQREQKKTWHFTKEDRDQIWAEAKYYYEKGEKLYLEGDMISAAEEVQREAMEVDERQGMVEEYLDTLLPENWDAMDTYARRNFLSEKDAPTSVKGTVRRETVSNAEIWCECFGRSLSDLKPADSYAIAALMTQIDGWQRTTKVRKRSPYGKQRLYERTCCQPENADK